MIVGSKAFYGPKLGNYSRRKPNVSLKHLSHTYDNFLIKHFYVKPNYQALPPILPLSVKGGGTLQKMQFLI
jgi:hypothetical protein